MKTSKQIQAEIARLQKAELKAREAEEHQRNLKSLYKAAEDFAKYCFGGDLLKAIRFMENNCAKNPKYAEDKEAEAAKKEAAKERRRQREAAKREAEAAEQAQQGQHEGHSDY